ncbi:hypothetical protein R1sor_021971 [Riccia sorocarpa]|uniref:Uncharacterized protein n=1 Tax=Riccia sorocarpa TaxID=122646 RepID=A0ABD3GLU7_9MARC
MAEGHLHREAMFFCSTILAQIDPTSPLLFQEPDDAAEIPLKLIGACTRRTLSLMEVNQIHNFVLHNSVLMESWIECSRRRPAPFPHLRDYMRNMQIQLVEKCAAGEDISQYPAIDEDLRIFIRGPTTTATSYNQCWHNGRHFRVRHLDGKKTGTTDCGVMGTWTQDFRSSGHDQNLERASMAYYGRLEEILEMDFLDFTQVLFSCRWYRSQVRGTRPTLEMDESGIQRVKTTQTLPIGRLSDEPFCYPSLVEQCFYVECSHDVDWSFVIPYIPRERQFVGSDSSAAI